MCCRTSPTGLSAATSIGRYVTVGQSCVLRSTTIEHECIIGDKSILMEGSLVESQSILAPGTVVTPGRLIPSGQLWAGNPARYVRDLTKDEVSQFSITSFLSMPASTVKSCYICRAPRDNTALCSNSFNPKILPDQLPASIQWQVSRSHRLL